MVQWSTIVMNMLNIFQLTRIMKKRFIGLFMLIATAILSGVALNKFLKWAGSEEIFDFDLDEDIDNDQL